MASKPKSAPLVTPDGRYIVVRGRLWRRANPQLSEAERSKLVSELMDARRAVAAALKARDADAETQARKRVDAAKHGLGERGPVWWSDAQPDLTRHLIKNTAYSDWFSGIGAG